MGFGILTLGYILLFMCRGADIFPDTLAYALMFYALIKLNSHSEYFKAAKFSMLALLPIGLATDIVQITAAVTAWEPGMVQTVISSANALALLVFHFFLFGAIRKQADELDIKKLSYSARRNWYITVLYYALTLITVIRPPFIEEFLKYFGIFFLILGIVWIVLNVMLIYCCYMRICLEGDEDMPEREGFIGRLNSAAAVDIPEKEAKSLEGRAKVQHKKKKK